MWWRKHGHLARLAVVFGVRLPRALTAAFIRQALRASEGIIGLSAAMRGLIAARAAVLVAVASIDAKWQNLAATWNPTGGGRR